MTQLLIQSGGANERDIRRFVETVRTHLKEAELYLAQAPSLAADASSTVIRRFQAVEREAADLGAEFVRDLCRAVAVRVDALAKSNQSNPELGDPILSAIEFTRGYLLCLELGIDRRSFAQDMAAFLNRTHAEILRRLQEPVSGPEKESEPPEESGNQPLRILVADDEEMVRSFLADLLEGAGHHLLAVVDGEDAITAVKTGLFELVVTDIKMPGADGIEVLKEAKAVCPDVEVVIITGYASVENAVDAVRFGAYDYLTKPFENPNDILVIVRRAQEHLSLRRHNHLLMLRLKKRNEELRRYAESLESALESVEEKQRALLHSERMATLGVLAAGVAHEINNPTTFIRGNLQTLQKFWDTMSPVLEEQADRPDNQRLRFILDETPGLIRDMTVGTERINKIVSSLRFFSYQGDKDKRVSVSIGECLEQALALVHNRTKGTVKVIRKLAPVLPPVLGNAQQLVQVFTNLFVNAADAMEEKQGSAVLRVSARLVEKHIHVTVIDNGPGIPEKIRGKIFDPFFTTKDIGDGIGLGLPLSLGIVRDHGGRLEAEVLADGAGAVFHVFLPIEGEAATAKARPRILIVDDDANARKILSRALRTTGRYDVDEAQSGLEALAKIAARLPELLILDVMMKDMDGFEVMAKLRADGAAQAMRILCLTALDPEGVRERLLTLGAADVIFKPFNLKKLLERTGQLCLKEKPAA